MKPILFSIDGLNIYSYGFLIACAFLISIFLAKREASRNNISSQIITDLGIVIIISGIIGARIGYVLLHWEKFSSNVVNIIKIYQGGVIFSTGFLFSVLACFVYIKRKKMDFFKIADCIIPYVALGQAVGRIGCFFNGCCYGIPTNSFWGVKFPHLPYSVYPTQLFSSAFLFLLFTFLKLFRRKLHSQGEAFFVYILLYSGFRFFLDYIRADAIDSYGNLSLFQYVTMGVFLIVLAGLSFKLIKSKIVSEKL